MARVGTYLNRFNLGVSLVSFVVLIVTFLVPQVRELARDHGVLGWSVAVVLLALVLARGGDSDTGTADQAAAAAAARVGAEAAERKQSLAKDLRLVRTRLGDWRVDSDFFGLLNNADYNFSPISAKREIQSRVRGWRNDRRAISDAELAEAWAELSAAADRYSAALGHLGTVYDGSADTRPGYLGLSHETPYPERQRLSDDLEGSTLAVMDALRDIEAVLHRLD
jgi:hypothetical protein